MAWRGLGVWMVLLAFAVIGFSSRGMVAWGAAPGNRIPPAAAKTVDFETEIRPLLAEKCFSCHGADTSEGSLRLDRKADALSGGASGPAIVIGKGAESRLIANVAGLPFQDGAEAQPMPPDGPPLTPEQIGLLRAWIDQGANWPDDPVAESQSSHWAYRPIRTSAPPAIIRSRDAISDLDRFVLARLEAQGIEPSPPAEPATLIRRLYLDLLGLPPLPADVDDFVSDGDPEAFERLVDRLLASPRFGERMGRHWLDLARYADSDGYEKDRPRPRAWRYREWVINAINRDLPFDEFSIQQLAGDLLENPTLEDRIATGFHRNTLTNTEGGVDQEEFRVKATVDRVNTTGTVWLGLTVACAQCHSHKYDPISQKEYYELLAFFDSLSETDVSVATSQEIDAYENAKVAYQIEHEPLVAALALFEKESLPARQAVWEGQFNESNKPPTEVAEIVAKPASERTEEQRAALAKHYRGLDEELKKLEAAIGEHASRAPADPAESRRADVLSERSPARTTHVLIRGDFLRPGAETGPNAPRVLPAIRSRGDRPDRLDLARWLMSPQHPLTARVTVNRLWRQFFGRGLVPSVDDFGSRGDPPSHPELLDALAAEFIADGWSVKRLCRRIVTSATYRQSAKARPDLAQVDPFNALLARQTRWRVEADIVRDLALAASGLLTNTLGGPSVHPPQPPGIADLTYAGSAKWVDSEGPERYRRGIYTWFQRTSPFPMLMTFDSPDSNLTCARRERSNTPLQALTLLNDPVFVECARALASRVVSETDGPANEALSGAERQSARLSRMFRLCLGREASGDELATLVALSNQAQAHFANAPEAGLKLSGGTAPEGVSAAEGAALMVVARTLLNLDEFITRE